MEESVLVEKAVEHARVDLLLLDHLGLAEVLHCDDQGLDPGVDLVWWGGEDVLEVLVGGFVDLVCVLRGRDLSWEQDGILCDEVLDLILSILAEDLL